MELEWTPRKKQELDMVAQSIDNASPMVLQQIFAKVNDMVFGSAAAWLLFKRCCIMQC